MNAQEIKNVAALISVFFGGIFAAHGATVSTAQITSFLTDLSVAIPALVSAGGAIYSVYTHWNMKKVPEQSVALMPTDPISKTTIENNIGTPVSIAGKVVGAILLGMILFSHDARAQTPAPSPVLSALTPIYASLNSIIGFASGFITADINAAIADAQTQTPPNAQAIACWSAIGKIPVGTIPTGAGLAYVKQRFLDLQSLYMPLNLNCGSVAPLFLKEYNQFMSMAASQNL